MAIWPIFSLSVIWPSRPATRISTAGVSAPAAASAEASRDVTPAASSSGRSAAPASAELASAPAVPPSTGGRPLDNPDEPEEPHAAISATTRSTNPSGSLGPSTMCLLPEGPRTAHPKRRSTSRRAPVRAPTGDEQAPAGANGVRRLGGVLRRLGHRRYMG